MARHLVSGSCECDTGKAPDFTARSKRRARKKNGKSSGKGKQKGDGKGKTAGKQDGSGKGKGFKSDLTCHKCGKVGHYARDCWSVRNVQADVQVQPNSTTQVASSSASTTSAQTSNAPQQGRVARIQFVEHDSDVSRHDGFVFDLRNSDIASSSHGAVRVVKFYIGDEPNTAENVSGSCHSVRTMLQDVPDETSMHNILLDSGADASVFPACMAELGNPSNAASTVLRDAQGKDIPIKGTRDIELHLMDMHGREVLLKETVSISDRVTQPILCFGKLMESGWSVNGVEQTLTHGAIAIPIEMQNRSMSVRGWVRMLKEEPEILDICDIRAVRADVLEFLSGMRVGWNLGPDGVGNGKHYGNCFQDPTLACPTMGGNKYRTTLVQDGDHWYVLELCEPLDSIIDLGAEFYGYEGDRSRKVAPEGLP